MAQSRRLQLHEIFVSVLGSRHVYFQPSSTVQMVYPCIVYSLAGIDTLFADDKIYRTRKKYMVTVIETNPDSDIPDKVLALPLCKFDRPYTVENLYHHVFTLYF